MRQRARMRWWEKVLWVLVPAVLIVGASLVAGDPAGAGSYTPTCEEQPQYYDCIPVTTTTTTTVPDVTTTVPDTTTTTPETTTTTTEVTTTTVPPSTVPRETVTTTTVFVSEPPECIDQPDLEGCPDLTNVTVAPPATPTPWQPTFTG